MSAMTPMRNTWWLLPALFGISFTILFLSMDLTINVYDEGIVLVSAGQIMDGRIIHRDFRSQYGPGSYAAIALLFSLFRPSFIIARLFGILVEATIVTTLFALLRHRTRAAVVFGSAAICLAWLIAQRNYLYPTFPCIALTLFSASLILRPDALSNWRVLFIAGACHGLSAYFRYDVGFFSMAAEAIAIALVLTRLPAIRTTGLMESIRAISMLGLGAAAIFAPGAIAYLLTSPLSAFRADIIDYGLRIYAPTRALPFPGLFEVISNPAELGVYIPLCAVSAAIPMTLKSWRDIPREMGSRPASAAVPFPLLFSLLSLILCYKGMVRVSTIHMMLAIVPSLALLAVVIDRWWTKPGIRRIAAALLFFSSAASATTAVMPRLFGFVQSPPQFVAGMVAEGIGAIPYQPDINGVCLAWPGMRFARLSIPYAQVAYYINRHSDASERILVGVDRHDRIFVNSVALYFAANRRPGTHWAIYDPGVQTSEGVQQDMVKELAHGNIRYIVRDASFDHVNEPNESAKSSNVHLLDAYIDEHYRPVGEAGEVQVWLRKDVTAPPTDHDPLACKLNPPA